MLRKHINPIRHKQAHVYYTKHNQTQAGTRKHDQAQAGTCMYIILIYTMQAQSGTSRHTLNPRTDSQSQALTFCTNREST